MARDLNEALNAVEMTYGQVKQIADDMLSSTFGPIDSLVAELSGNIERLSVDMLRDYLLRVQLSAYSLWVLLSVYSSGMVHTLFGTLRPVLSYTLRNLRLGT